MQLPKAVLCVMTLTSPLPLAAESRLAPPANPSEVARTASAVFIGRLMVMKSETLDNGTRQEPLVVLTFTVENLMKTHESTHEGATLASGRDVTEVNAADGNQPNSAIRDAKFALGERYLVFLAWDERNGLYWLHYGPYTVFRVEETVDKRPGAPSARLVPLFENTELAGKALAMTKDTFMKEVQSGIRMQKP